MIAYPAIDLRGGRVVQLVGGIADDERVNLPDPPGVARQWLECGFVALHIVDLDAALSAGHNDDAVRAIIDAAGDAPVQVGGGIRSTERAAEILGWGATRIIVGTRAVEDPAWLREIADRWPGRVIVAADVRGDEIVIKGWTAGAGLAAETFLEGIGDMPLAAVLVTDVSREGRMVGADAPRFGRLAALSPLPLLAAGGIAGADDLAALRQAGAAGAVLGMALYTGALDAHAAAREYGA